MVLKVLCPQSPEVPTEGSETQSSRARFQWKPCDIVLPPIFGLWEASSHPKVDGIMWRRLAETVQLDTAVPFPVLSAPGLLENVGVPFQRLGTPIRSKTKKSYIYPHIWNIATGIYGIVWVLYILDYKPLTKWDVHMHIATWVSLLASWRWVV